MGGVIHFHFFMLNTIQNGKGSRPRSGYNKCYRDNFDEIFGKICERCKRKHKSGIANACNNN